MAIYVGDKRYAPYIGDKRREVRNKKALPYDAEIEYLESTGTQWIDTGIVFKKFLYLNFDAQYTANFSTTQVIAGPSASGGCWVGNASPGKWAITSTSPSSDSSVKSKVEIVYDNSTLLYVDGTAKGNQARPTNPSNPIAIFNAYTGGFPSSARLYSFRIEDWTDENNKIILFNAIPVRIGTTGYLYDKVSGQLFGNAGTDAFVLGPDKSTLPYDAEVEYLQTDGAAYIDTGVKVSSDITFDINIYIPDVVIDFCLFGARVTSSSGQMLYINNAKSWNRKEWWFAGVRITQATKLAYNNVYNFKNTESRNVLKISNGSTLTANDATFTTDNNFYLLTVNNNGTPLTSNIAAGARILPSKIYENGIMVRDYICVRKDGVGYLYDKVSGELFGNSGTGDFVLGPDKT